MEQIKRILSLFLAFVMVWCALPATTAQAKNFGYVETDIKTINKMLQTISTQCNNDTARYEAIKWILGVFPVGGNNKFTDGHQYGYSPIPEHFTSKTTKYSVSDGLGKDCYPFADWFMYILTGYKKISEGDNWRGDDKSQFDKYGITLTDVEDCRTKKWNELKFSEMLPGTHIRLGTKGNSVGSHSIIFLGYDANQEIVYYVDNGASRNNIEYCWTSAKTQNFYGIRGQSGYSYIGFTISPIKMASGWPRHTCTYDSVGQCTTCNSDYIATNLSELDGVVTVKSNGRNTYSRPYTASTVVESGLKQNTQLTVTGVVTNHYGNTWYRVRTSNGLSWINEDNVTYTESPNTILASSSIKTSTIVQGTSLWAKNGEYSGKIWSSNGKTKLSSVSFGIYNPDGTLTKKTSGSDNIVRKTGVNATSYTIVDADDTIMFSALKPGTYYFEISGTDVKGNTGSSQLWFEVVAKNSSSSHTHTVVTDLAVKPTCTETGLTAGQHCSVCGEILAAQTVIPATGHTVVKDEVVAATCTQGGLTAGSHCSVCNTVLVQQKYARPIGHIDTDHDLICDSCSTSVSPKDMGVELSVSLKKSYLLLTADETAKLPAVTVRPAAYADLVQWRLESTNNGVDCDEIAELGTSEITGLDSGTVYAVAYIAAGDEEYSARCRIDVVNPTAENPEVHAVDTSVTTNIYSTNYSTVDVVFDMPDSASAISVFSLSEKSRSSGSGETIDYAYFTDRTAAELFDLYVIDDRTLEIVPTLDVENADAIKAVKSSYKSAITVVVDGEELVTPEVVSIKVDKKLPTVKASAVKLNSFYSGHTMPLVLTCQSGQVLEVELDEDNAQAKGNPCPDWLALNYDMSVSLAENITKASGKLYLKAYVEGYSAPASVVVSVSAAMTAPKLKLSATKLTFNQYRLNTIANRVNLVSADKNVAFDDIGILDVTIPSYESMTAKDRKTYAANQYYEVTDFNIDTGCVCIDVKDGCVPVKGKLLLACEVADSDYTVNLPLSVEVYTKAPTIKLSSSSITLNPNIRFESGNSSSNVTGISDFSLYDGLSNISNLSCYIEEEIDWGSVFWIHYEWQNNTRIYESSIADWKSSPFTKAEIEELRQKYIPIWKADENFTIGSEPLTASGHGFPSAALSETNYVLILHMDQNYNYLGYSQFLIHATGSFSNSSDYLKYNDEASIKMTVTPADLEVEMMGLDWSITDSKKNVVNNELSVYYVDGKILVGTNDDTVPGMTYKVNFWLDGMTKPTVLTVKTLAENKSTVKLALSTKGKLETGNPDSIVTITPKWTNLCGNNFNLSSAYTVYATLPGEYTNRDVTDCFEIWYNGDGTYSLKVTDLLAMEKLHPKATYTLAIDDLTIGNPISASTKLNLALTKAKIGQSAKSVNLYSNDRYSTAVVELQLKDNTLLDISDVVLEENAKKPSAFEARYLGDGEVEISFKDNQATTKAGSVKLNVYLEGNNVANGQPNATVSVSVKVTKFKNR